MAGLGSTVTDAAGAAPDDEAAADAGWQRFRTYWVGHLLSFCGDWFTIIALPLVAWEIERSTLYVGIVEFSEIVATLAIGMRLGGLADRLHPRRAMIAADVLRAAVLAVVAVWTAIETPPLFVLPLAAFLLGSLRDLHDGAENVMVVSVVPASLLVRANGRFQVSDGLGHVMGALLAGVAATLGHGVLFGVDALTFVIAAGAVLAMGSFPVHRDPEPELAPWRTTVAALRAEDRYWRLVATMVVANITTICFMGQFVPFAQDELDLHTWQIGATLAVMGVGSVAAGLALDRVRSLRPGIMLPAIAAMSAATVLTGLARSWPVTIVAFVINGAVVALGMATVGSLRHGAFAPGLQGRVALASRLAFSSGVLPGVVVGGLVAEHVGSAEMFVIFGAAAGVATVVGLALGVHRLPAPDPDADDADDGSADADGANGVVDLRPEATVIVLDPPPPAPAHRPAPTPAPTPASAPHRSAMPPGPVTGNGPGDDAA